MLPDAQEAESIGGAATKFYPIGMSYLPEALKQKAKDELGETEEKIQVGTRIIRDRLKKHNVNFMEDDSHILRFLRIRKYNYDKSFSSIKQHTQFGGTFRQKLGYLNSESIKKVLRRNFMGMLPYKDSEGRAIMFYVTGVHRYEDASPKDVVSAIVVATFLLMEDPATQVSGVVTIIDAENLSMYEAPYMRECIMTLSMILRADPGRFKRVDILNENPVAGFFIRIAKAFLPTKVGKRITLHGNRKEDLLQHYDASVLPYEFGGTLGPLSNDHWIDRVDRLVDVINDFIRRYSTEETN